MSSLETPTPATVGSQQSNPVGNMQQQQPVLQPVPVGNQQHQQPVLQPVYVMRAQKQPELSHYDSNASYQPPHNGVPGTVPNAEPLRKESASTEPVPCCDCPPRSLCDFMVVFVLLLFWVLVGPVAGLNGRGCRKRPDDKPMCAIGNMVVVGRDKNVFTWGKNSYHTLQV